MAEEFLADWQQKLQQMHAKEVASGQPLVPLMPQGEDDYIGYSMNEVRVPTKESQIASMEEHNAKAEVWNPDNPEGRGMNGELLPPGATAWDKYGEPYYGPGFDGWRKRLKYKLGGDPEVIGAREGMEKTDSVFEEAKRTLAGWGMAKRVAPEEGEEDLDEFELESPLKATWKGVRIGWNALTGVYQAADDARERIEGTVHGTLKDEAAESGLPNVFEEATKLGKRNLEGSLRFIGVSDENTQKVSEIIDRTLLLRFQEDMRRRVVPGMLVGDAGKALWAMVKGDLTPEEMQRITEDNWQAARIQYTYAYEPAVKEEFIRQYREGKDPNLIAINLENPIAEAVGEFIFDGAAMFSIGSQMLGLETNRLRRASSIYGMTPEVRKAVSAATKETATANDVEKVVTASQKAAKDIVNDLVTSGKKYGLHELLAESKQKLFNDRAANTIRAIATTFKKNPDDIMDIFSSLMKLSSDNVDEVREAVVTLQHFAGVKGGEVLFSQAGMEVGYFFKKMLTNADGVIDAEKFLDNVKSAQQVLIKTGDAEPLITLTHKTVKGATADLFKTVLQRVDEGEEISPLVVAAAKSDVLASVPMQILNKGIVSIFMGMNPGYAARNILQNTVQVAIDQGIGTAGRVFGASLSEVPPFLQDMINIFKKGNEKAPVGKFTYGAIEDIRHMLGYVPQKFIDDVKPETAVRGTENLLKGKLGQLFNPMLNLSGRTEKAAHAIVQRDSIFQDLTKMLKEGRAIPDTAELISNGIDEGTAKSLVNLMKAHWGDVDEVMKIYKDGVTKGYVTLFETGEWLDKVDTRALDKLGVLETVKQASTTAASKDELIEAVEAMRKGLITDRIEKLKKTLPQINPNEIAGTETEKLLKNLQKDLGNSVHGPLYASRRYAQKRVIDLYEAALKDVVEALRVTDKTDDQVKVANQASRFLSEELPDILFENTQAVDKATAATTAMRERWYQLPSDVSSEVLEQMWREKGIGEKSGIKMPKDLNKHSFLSAMWEDHFFNERLEGAKFRENLRLATNIVLNNARNAGIDVDNMANFIRATEASNNARKLDTAVVWSNNMIYHLDDVAERNFSAIAKLANEYGIETYTDTGKVNNKYLLNIINKHGDTKYESIFDVPFAEARKALDNYAESKGMNKVSIFLKEGMEELKVGKAESLIPEYNGGTPDANRVAYETAPAMNKVFDDVIKSIDENWGKLSPVYDNPEDLKHIGNWLEEARGRVADAKTAAFASAQAKSEWALHSYDDKYGFDRMLSYIWPFEYWYSRTYAKWMGRAFETPQVLAGYSRYRRTMEKIHAGMPEWWRYQVNTNELLGLDNENPLYFNLEAALWPLNGITGVDFDDPQRHPEGTLNWLTTSLDDMNKLGATTHPVFSWATALALYSKGETDAAKRWGGRLIPATQGIKAITHKLGIPGQKGTGLELDPFVHFMYKGFDAYELRRVNRAMAQLTIDGVVDEATAYEQSYYMDGEYWDMAADKAQSARDWGNIASFLLGVGFKARSKADLKIDEFYADYYRLRAMKGDLTPDEYNDMRNQLRTEHPYMDIVLLSVDKDQRDESFAYHVLNRIPPGQSDQLSEWAGLDYAYLNKFYEAKGDMRDWDKADRDTFMAAMLNIGTILDMPDEATRGEWTEAKSAYANMNLEMQRIFGDDILEKIDEAFRAESMDKYFEMHPNVEKALDWKDLYMMENQTLMTYYKGIDGINRYYKSFAYDQIDEELGKDIYDLSAQYKWLKDNGGNHKGFLQEHPELKRYWEIWDEWDETIATETMKFGTRLPEMKPATIRPGVEPKTIGEKQLFEEMQRTEPLIPWQQWQDLLPATEVRNFMSGIEPDRNSLQLYADVLGLDLDVMIDMVRESLPSR